MLNSSDLSFRVDRSQEEDSGTATQQGVPEDGSQEPWYNSHEEESLADSAAQADTPYEGSMESWHYYYGDVSPGYSMCEPEDEEEDEVGQLADTSHYNSIFRKSDHELSMYRDSSCRRKIFKSFASFFGAGLF